MIGNKIAEARKKLSLSQAQLAAKLFISAQAVGKWERGESLPDIITLNKLANILNVDLNYFSGGFDSSEAETASNPEENTKDNQPKKVKWDMSTGNWVDADFSGLMDLQENSVLPTLKTVSLLAHNFRDLY